MLETENHQVISSVNLALINLDNKSIDIKIMLRSSKQSSLDCYEKKYISFAQKFNFDFTLDSESPFFEAQKNFKIEKICNDTYKQLFNTEAKSVCVHGGLEAGIFFQNIKNVECVVLGADLINIHSPTETMKISSLFKLEKWLRAILIEFNKK